MHSDDRVLDTDEPADRSSTGLFGARRVSRSDERILAARERARKASSDRTGKPPRRPLRLRRLCNESSGREIFKFSSLGAVITPVCVRGEPSRPRTPQRLANTDGFIYTCTPRLCEAIRVSGYDGASACGLYIRVYSVHPNVMYRSLSRNGRSKANSPRIKKKTSRRVRFVCFFAWREAHQTEPGNIRLALPIHRENSLALVELFFF